MITTLLRCVTIMRFNKLAISNRAENILNPSTSKLLPCTTIIRIDRDNHRDLRGNFFVSKMTRKHRQQRIQQERRRDHLQVLLYASGLPSIQTIQIAQRKQTLHDRRHQRFLLRALQQLDHVLHETLHIEQLSRHACSSLAPFILTARRRLLANQRQHLLQKLSRLHGLFQPLIVRLERVSIEQRAEQQQQQRLHVVRAQNVVRERFYPRIQSQRPRENTIEFRMSSVCRMFDSSDALFVSETSFCSEPNPLASTNASWHQPTLHSDSKTPTVMNALLQELHHRVQQVVNHRHHVLRERGIARTVQHQDPHVT